MTCQHTDGHAAPPGAWERWLEGSVASLHERSLFRTLRPTVPGLSAVEAAVSQADIDAWVSGRPPASLAIDAAGGSAALPSCSRDADLRIIKLFSLNDYLGLSTHPAVRRAAADAALQCGNGPRSSALVGGYTVWHARLEAALAELKGTEDCLLFPTGFAANLAVASVVCEAGPQGSSSSGGSGGEPRSQQPGLGQHPGLSPSQQQQHHHQGQQQQEQQQQPSQQAQPHVVVLSDELNHASIVDGARLGRRDGARLLVYRHNDLRHLEQLLRSQVPQGARAVVITDSLFSMDGDFADLPGLAALRRKYGFLLVVDEAHATLVCGERGGGAAEMFGVAADVDLHVGTLSKAFGCLGGFVACSRRWKQLLQNRGRTQVFSTALPVPVAAAAHAALRVAAEEPWRRERVWQLARRLGRELGVPVCSPIVPLIVGPEQAAVDASAALLQRGLHVPAIRPPTVPRGTSRLRVSLSAAHSGGDLDQLLAALRACGLRFRGVDAVLGGAAAAALQAGAAACEMRPQCSMLLMHQHAAPPIATAG